LSDLSISQFARGARKRLKLECLGRFGRTPSPEKWVFIVGCYNSGTTLLHQLLGSHERCGSMPSEGQYYTTELLVPRSVGLPRLWALEPERFHLTEESQPPIDVTRLKRQWGGFYNDPHRPVLLEKTPVNAARIRWLQKHFENAHFIAIVRNGYAVAEGIRRKGGHDIGLAATQWARSNQIMLEDLPNLRKHLLVRYERLTEAPDEVLCEMLGFLELEAVGVSATNRSWRVHRDQSEIRNMNPRSFAALSAADRDCIRYQAGYMLDRFGYDCD
jgi:hypothetical protein